MGQIGTEPNSKSPHSSDIPGVICWLSWKLVGLFGPLLSVHKVGSCLEWSQVQVGQQDSCGLPQPWKRKTRRQTKLEWQEVHSWKASVSIIQQTRQLHAENNVLITLREHLRIRIASMNVVRHRFTNQNAAESSAPDTFLNMRLEDAYNLLEYYNVTATGLLEQQENLLSLVSYPRRAGKI